MATRAHVPWGFPKAPRIPVCTTQSYQWQAILHCEDVTALPPADSMSGLLYVG